MAEELGQGVLSMFCLSFGYRFELLDNLHNCDILVNIPHKLKFVHSASVRELGEGREETEISHGGRELWETEKTIYDPHN